MSTVSRSRWAGPRSRRLRRVGVGHTGWNVTRAFAPPRNRWKTRWGRTCSSATRQGPFGQARQDERGRWAMQPNRLVVLASGMGSRLRSKTSPKPLVALGGLSLIERAIAGARQAGFDEVVVVTG